MAMRVRATTPVAPIPKKGKHGAKCDVVSILTASSLIKDQIDSTMRGPLPALLHTETCIRFWSALGQIKHNAPVPAVWTMLGETLNIGMLLAEDGLGLEYLQVFVDAQEALFRGWLRGERTGSFRLDGPGIAVITEALEIHDVQLDVACWADVTRAERTMVDRINAGELFAADPVAA